VRSTPGVEHVTSIVGYSMIDGLTKSNSAVLVMTLKPFGERKDAALSANGIIARLQREFQGIQEAVAFAYNLPPIIGLGTGSGFEYQLLSQGGGSPVDLAAVARGLVFAANQEPTLERVFTTYNANTPQLYLDIDREKLQTLGVDLSDVLQRAAIRARQLLRQRLQPVRPNLAGADPGRGIRPRQGPPTSFASTCATRPTTWCRSAPLRACA
jgi:multidrug efflux pump subunit AcrB